VEATHDLHIQRLERVSSGLHKVHTCVHTVIDDVHPVHLVFRIEIGIETLLNVLHNWSP
jgi:hypothetical protein